MNTAAQSTRSRCKVDHLAEEYGIRNLDQRIAEERKEEDASLRDLEAFVNQEILKVVLKRSGVDLIEGDVENYYRLLDADEDDDDNDVSPDARQEAVQQLEQAGVDVESLEEDFVSYQTVRSHLQECLDIDTSRESNINTDQARNTFDGLKNRTINVVERTLERLDRHGKIEMGDPTASVSIKVECDECNRMYTPNQILRNEGCECSHSEETPPSVGSVDDDQVSPDVSGTNGDTGTAGSISTPLGSVDDLIEEEHPGRTTGGADEDDERSQFVTQ